MAIEKAIIPVQGEAQEGDPELIVKIENPDSVALETDDGSVVIDFDPTQLESQAPSHDSNLADYMDESDLTELSSELVSMYISDRGSRKDWENTYTKGLKLLGLEIEDLSLAWGLWCIPSCIDRINHSLPSSFYYGNLSSIRTCTYTDSRHH